MSPPFFTPIFDRGWVGEMQRQIAREKRKKESLKYVLVEPEQEYDYVDEEYEE